MRSLSRSLSSLALLAALAVPALADVTPGGGTIGTEFTATFSGDVPSKPKIVLSFIDATAKSPKAVAKVTGVEGGAVTFVIQAANGGGSFRVGLSGSDETAGELQLVPPVVDDVDKTTVGAGEELTFTGDRFGEDQNKRNAPKVFVNGKKAKTLSFTNGELRIQLHKSTPAGLADITIANKVGETTYDGVVTVTAPPKPIKGPDSLAVRIAGKALKVKFTKKSPEAVVGVLNIGNNQVQITAVKNSGNPRRSLHTQNLNLIFLLPTTLDQLTVPASFNPVASAIYLDSTTTLSGGIPPTPTTRSATYTNEAGGSINLTITGRSGNRITGTFSGTLSKAGGDGPASMSFEGGSFTVTLEQ